MEQKNPFDFFKFVHKNTPAYQQFLKDNKINFLKIRSLNDFKKLPFTNKENYLKKYHYADLFPKGRFHEATTIAATSGSTGEPFYFPRGQYQDWQYEFVAKNFLKNQFDVHRKKTLGIIGFALGIWIGGIFTYKNLNKLSEKKVPMTLIPVGNNKDLFLKSFTKFAPYFDQTILMGYAPFIKDILEEGENYDIIWSNHSIKIITAAEGFSEKFRNHISQVASLQNPLNDIINIYGTVELGTMAYATAICYLIRKIASENQFFFKVIFPKINHMPTLAQYYPQLVYFEEVENQVIATGYGSSIPLIRYDLGDLGGVINFKTMITKLKNCGIDIFEEARKLNIENKILKLPFVYVASRRDYSITLSGANIYPEEIKTALEKPALNNFITGRFTMIKKEHKNLNQYLEVNIELKKNVNSLKNINQLIQNNIINNLCQNNSEFNILYSADATKVIPKILLWPYQDLKYFNPTIKQKWIFS